MSNDSSNMFQFRQFLVIWIFCVIGVYLKVKIVLIVGCNRKKSINALYFIQRMKQELKINSTENIECTYFTFKNFSYLKFYIYIFTNRFTLKFVSSYCKWICGLCYGYCYRKWKWQADFKFSLRLFLFMLHKNLWERSDSLSFLNWVK